MKATPKRLSRKRAAPAKVVREKAAIYRAPKTPRTHARWKIPAITPTGMTAPVSETLPRAVKRIAEALNPDKIILFGSYAYGHPTPDSDVDLLVVMDTDATGTERTWAVSRLLIPRPFPVDILVRTPKEIRGSIRSGDFFIKEIISKGKVLHERRNRPDGVGREGRRRL